MIQAPNAVDDKQLKELHIKLNLPKEIDKGTQSEAKADET